ncbi:transcription elongation factor GreB [Salinibius halmophilus]|uniref:transcription elongation factor GreB n=1 Tax=Salinibius halmophilus TaxID=1853216 RepID=UPI000E65F0E4|nr:transcription elongation factor GreB [Salinibius halmophilus]
MPAPYITPEGHQAMQDELDFLWRDERPRITQSVHEAALQGDRSENAEYIYGKKRLREIDRRVRFLRKRLAAHKVVDQLPDDTSRIFFGAWVRLSNEQDEIMHLRIVGSDEFRPDKNYISIDSPMAKALLGKQVDDEALVRTPTGAKLWFVEQISYHGPLD